MRQSMQQHRGIVAALRAADAGEAERLLHEHIAVQGEKFTDLVAQYGDAQAAGGRLRAGG
jgi:DNA-binding GntR family transcriptional regulator